MVLKGKMINEHLLLTERDGYIRVLCPTSMCYVGEAYFELSQQDSYWVVKDIIPTNEE